MRKGVLALLLLTSVVGVSAMPDFEREQIENRIKPIGQVRTEREVVTSPKLAVEAATDTTKTRSGKAIYEQYCRICHESGLAGAPKLQADDWKARLQAKKIEGLIASAVKGLNAMPPRGTCMDCTDADLKAAIEYMVPKS